VRTASLNRIGDHVEVKEPGGTCTGTLLEKLSDDEWRFAPDQHWRGLLAVPVAQILRKLPTTVDRETGPTVYYRERAAGKPVGSLHHRQVQALVAVRAGLGRARLRRTQAPWFCDYHLEPEVAVYGIGRGTVSELQHQGYIEQRQDEGPLNLTAKGDRVLDEILALEGASLPPMVAEVAA
jgi:hypothetical protein